jgi:hypothetical protein
MHPAAAGKFVSSVEVRVLRTEDSLVFGYVLTADLSNIRIPFSVSTCRAERLWEHTCFEAFVRAKGQTGYYEFNFSPSGEWAAFAFRGYRQRAPFEPNTSPPEITVRQTDERLELSAKVCIDHLRLKELRVPLSLGLAAVIEDVSGRLSYWALKHPPGKPDFHHPDSFALEIHLAGQDS